MSVVSRRNFLKLSAFAGLSLTAAGAYGSTTEEAELTHTNILIENLPREFNDYRIGFISDLHLSAFVPDEWIEQAINLINKSNVDLAVLGGDYVWIHESYTSRLVTNYRNLKLANLPQRDLPPLLYQTLGKILGGIKAKDGAYAVHGNHDRWVGPELCREHFAAQNIELLINTKKTFKRGSAYLNLVGTDDYWTGVPSIPLAPRKGDAKEVRVILSHNPDYFSYLLKHKNFEFDLGLAGHTHGGQICLPLIGAPSYNIQDLRLAAGLYREGNYNIYTSRGIGVVDIPVRINCPPEVSILSLLPT